MVPSAARGDLDRCADMLPIGDARGPWAARLGARERRPSHGSDRDHRASPATPNRRAGLSHAAVHRLRRTLATDLLRHGARLVEVGVAAAELAGVVLWRCACSQWRGWRARAPGARGWRACLPVGGLIRTSLDAPLRCGWKRWIVRGRMPRWRGPGPAGISRRGRVRRPAGRAATSGMFAASAWW